MQENNLYSKTMAADIRWYGKIRILKKLKTGGLRLGDRAGSSCKREILRGNSKAKGTHVGRTIGRRRRNGINSKEKT